MKIKTLFILFFSFTLTVSVAQSHDNSKTETVKKERKRKKKKRKKYKLPKIDLSHWKVTTPAGNGKKPQEVSPPEILDYATNEDLLPYMYNDSVRGAIVFYAYPSKATTANTKYSRSELREQMEPGNNNVNWTFKQGGKMKGKLAIDEVSRDK
ncbi:MAG: polysaccharide lyase family 7 protein, partial [Kordia sp.]|uniref:polysaccharide lyase family 7 protein n=1 Tax=Kordia sp. TaxID=1965332 RepID=UPI0038594231